jgi:molecular chaperone Hsp33
MADHLVRIITKEGTLRGIAAVTTDLVEECRRRQGTDPTATVALGRLATGAALMGALLKGQQRLALSVEGNGPLHKVQAETDAFGAVRASIKNPLSGVAPTPQGFDVPAAIGRAGFLHVIKDLGLKEPYRGMVQLQSSEIAQDLAYYLTTSEQLPSTVALGVYLQEDGSVGCAGGFMLQVMPPGNEDHIARLESRLLKMPAPTALLRQGLGPQQILAQLFGDIAFEVVSETPLKFICRCTRSQVAGMLKTLGQPELQKLLAEGQAEVTCEYCKEVYCFSRDELAALSA